MNSQFAQFIPLILNFVIFYFLLLIRPAKKGKKNTRQWSQSLKRGDEVITSGGILGESDKELWKMIGLGGLYFLTMLRFK